jgi:triosephosphate isomerase
MLIAGNWKMFKDATETAAFCHELAAALGTVEDVDVAVCPPYTSLVQALAILGGTSISVCAQSVHWEAEGAFTGEISPGMLRDLGVAGALAGHSERRQYFAETDETTAKRAKAALDAGLWAIACVGETEAEREAGETEAVLERQVRAIAEAVDEPEGLVLAYEPVWAIGTGRTATPEQAQQAHAFIRKVLATLSKPAVAKKVRIQYGGSVKPGNTAELMTQPDIDGALVGGASLEPRAFAEIVQNAVKQLD